jgi:multidrug efflux pump subunit AcrB
VAQFFISLAGAIGLVVTAIVYLLRWRWAVVVSAAASTALGCAWLAFLATS